MVSKENRKVILGPFQAGFLAAVDHEANRGLTKQDKARIDVGGLFYAWMIQAGVENFDTIVNLPLAPTSEFLRSRAIWIPPKKYQPVFERIEKVFEKFFPPDFETNKSFVAIKALKYFLMDLALAVERNSSVVLMHPLPPLSTLAGSMPLELYMPLKTLFDSFETVSVNLPFPTEYLDPTHFTRFEKLVCSDLFERYSQRHAILEDGKILKIDAERAVERSGSRLIENNRTLLHARKLGISLLPITSKIVDTAFGKIPGAFSEFITSGLLEWVKNDRRIVVYHFQPVDREISLARLRMQVRSNDS